jgi:hypothetical protein
LWFQTQRFYNRAGLSAGLSLRKKAFKMALHQSNSGRKPQNGELHLFISWIFRGKRRKAKTVKIDVKVVFFALKRAKTRAIPGFS